MPTTLAFPFTAMNVAEGLEAMTDEAVAEEGAEAAAYTGEWRMGETGIGSVTLSPRVVARKGDTKGGEGGGDVRTDQ